MKNLSWDPILKCDVFKHVKQSFWKTEKIGTFNVYDELIVLSCKIKFPNNHNMRRIKWELSHDLCTETPSPVTELEEFRHDIPRQFSGNVTIGIKLFLWFVFSLLLNHRLQSQFQLSWIPHSASLSCCEAYSQPNPSKSLNAQKLASSKPNSSLNS